jgi:integrase
MPQTTHDVGLALKWEDVDLEAGALSVRRLVSEDEGGPVIREETKTSPGRRLELLPVAIEALKGHRLRHTHVREPRAAEASLGDARARFHQADRRHIHPRLPHFAPRGRSAP